MKRPILDARDQDAIMRQVETNASSYTPEWRYEKAEDDPGSALAELFGELFYQTVDRMNSVPEKLHTEFLNLIGFQMPDPVPAAGLVQFVAHDTVDAAVPVPEGTQIFTPDGHGENVVYETVRSIQSTPAQLTGLYYVDPRAEVIQKLALDRPQPLFSPTDGENLQRHRFAIYQNDVLSLSGPCQVEVDLRREGGFPMVELARQLASPEGGQWTFHSKRGELPFSKVQVEGSTILLTYDGTETWAEEDEGRFFLSCSGKLGAGSLILDGIGVRSQPAGRLAMDSVESGDVPLNLEEGDYCFGRRPTAYNLCYFRSDQVFRKRGSRVNLRLEIAPVVTEWEDAGPKYQFNQYIIDKRDSVAIVPDDVYIDQVLWEYFNGYGWRPLSVSGNRNPFSCKQEGELEVVFDVPKDLVQTEVNAQPGWYIRARVLHVKNEFSQTPRWVVPFLKRAECTWAYSDFVPVDRCVSENNGDTVVLDAAGPVERLAFPALVGLEEHPKAVYFCFDRSPHAMPLSILFDVAGRVILEDKVRFEAWTGKRFEPVRSVDLTRNLLHSGTMLLYLSRPLPERTLFGKTGHWLRLIRSSYFENRGGWPWVNGIRLNIVEAVQRERTRDEIFSAGIYEANKVLTLLHHPTQKVEVWVDEVSSLPVADAEQLANALPDRVRMEWDDRVLTHCWVRWERRTALALAERDERCYQLDPYAGTITFGDGVHGRVPPQGDEAIRVSYCFGGGVWGNRPAGAVTNLVGSLPRIRELRNITPMSGGTDRVSPEKVDRIGNKRLRHRNRAISARDFEEIVLQDFPQARHVKCFPGRDAAGKYAPGHVSVVIEGCDLDSPRVTDDLCERIYQAISQQCDCVMTAEGRLHVVGSTVITVNSTVTVEMEDPDHGAATQQAIVQRLEQLIDGRWREREIGSQLRIAQVWQTVRDTPNVRLVRSVLLEGCFDQAGIPRVVALEDDEAFPYATVKSGIHMVQVE